MSGGREGLWAMLGSMVGRERYVLFRFVLMEFCILSFVFFGFLLCSVSSVLRFLSFNAVFFLLFVRFLAIFHIFSFFLRLFSLLHAFGHTVKIENSKQ